MARHKFEKDFSRKLREREIEPSADSWEKLQARLETAEKKEKSAFSLKWMGIAATIVGGLLILGLTFNAEVIQEAEEMVDAPSEEIKIKKEDQLFEQVEIASEEIEKPENSEPSEVKEKENINKTPAPENTVIATVSEEEYSEPDEIEVKPEFDIAEEQITGKLEEVVAAISSEETSGGDMTDAEVDELLRQAAAEISMQKSVANTENVDAGSLLYEVEMELERSFRDKVFEVLKESYLRTKTAVANRSF